MEDNDAQLQLKKRARRRLIGAVFFASVVAVVLPAIMDQEPRQAVQDVEIRIPGQDDKAFAPKFAAAPVEKAAEATPPKPSALPTAVPVEKPVAAAPTARVIETTRDKGGEKATEAALAAKPPEKPSKPDKPVDKASEKAAADKLAADRAAAEKAAAERQKAEDARRAAAILAGQTAGEAAKPAAAKAGGEQLILIGAFNNEENVRILKSKLGELGIRVYTEPLETPQGRKTRVRAGPFPSREAADKALEKMKKIGVSGVIAARS